MSALDLLSLSDWLKEIKRGRSVVYSDVETKTQMGWRRRK